MEQETKPKIKPSWAVTFCVILVCITAVLFGILAVTLSLTKETLPRVTFEKERYYAVFLTNGQVYFGYVTKLRSNYLALCSVYYLQTEKSLQAPKEEESISLVKLGKEIHGPEDLMVINRDQILFFEPLKEDSQLVKAILEYKE